MVLRFSKSSSLMPLTTFSTNTLPPFWTPSMILLKDLPTCPNARSPVSKRPLKVPEILPCLKQSTHSWWSLFLANRKHTKCFANYIIEHHVWDLQHWRLTPVWAGLPWLPKCQLKWGLSSTIEAYHHQGLYLNITRNHNWVNKKEYLYLRYQMI